MRSTGPLQIQRRVSLNWILKDGYRFSRQKEQPGKDVEALNFRQYQESRLMFLRVGAHSIIIISTIGVMTESQVFYIVFYMPGRVLSALLVSTLFMLTSKSMRWHYYFHFTVSSGK